ncbi:MAG: glutamate racemase [Candidatus Saccharimonadales bacterium]
MKIGVFDSGIGGLSVAQAIEKALPEHEVIFRDDRKHLPYGSRTPEELIGYVVPIFNSLVEDDCQVIVVACNTITTTLIKDLRKIYKIPLIAVEPMVKPAAEQTISRVIAVCATPTTLKSERYRELKNTYARNFKVVEPDCSDWSLLIENKVQDKQKIFRWISEVLDQGADVIVLACTHYHWIEKEIVELSKDKAVVLQPEEAIIDQLKRVLSQLR